MLMIFVFIMIVGILSTMVMFIGSLLSKKMNKSREKDSPFECGFDPNCSARTPFSLQFFLIAMIFLIFDVEITLLLPFSVVGDKSVMLSWGLNSWLFIMILLIGLYYEWLEGALEWLK